MEREIIQTEDGSSSIFVKDLGETYHSVHGAVQEALHVYIENGMKRCEKKSLSILEMGFGTGLNFVLSYQTALALNISMNYVGVEAYPITEQEWMLLNYDNVTKDLPYKLHDIHSLEWDINHSLSDFVSLTKRHSKFENLVVNEMFDVIYYDAFGYNYQPELWTLELFQKMYNALFTEGILVTYACKGIIKQNLRAAGFKVKRVPGPPGKREMIVAYKK